VVSYGEYSTYSVKCSSNGKERNDEREKQQKNNQIRTKLKLCALSEDTILYVRYSTVRSLCVAADEGKNKCRSETNTKGAMYIRLVNTIENSSDQDPTATILRQGTTDCYIIYNTYKLIQNRISKAKAKCGVIDVVVDMLRLRYICFAVLESEAVRYALYTGTDM
jgi:hypothetical protein